MIYDDRFSSKNNNIKNILQILSNNYSFILFQVKKEARRYFLIINPIRLIAIYIMDYINKIISMIHNPFGIILNLTMLLIITSLNWLSNMYFLSFARRFSKQFIWKIGILCIMDLVALSFLHLLYLTAKLCNIT